MQHVIAEIMLWRVGLPPVRTSLEVTGLRNFQPIFLIDI